MELSLLLGLSYMMAGTKTHRIDAFVRHPLTTHAREPGMLIRYFVLTTVALFFASSTLQAELVGLFNFDEDLTNAALGGAALTGNAQTFEPGFDGSAVYFNGRNDRLNLDIGPTTEHTFGAWVRTTSPQDEQPVIRLADLDNRNTNRGIVIADGPGSTTQWNALTGTNALSIGDPVDTDWTFVAARYDGTTATLFVDGQRVSGPDNTELIADGELRIGMGVNGGERFEGFIDNLFLFDHALTDQQINSIRIGGSNAILNVTAVPEPSVVFAGAIVVSALFIRRRRRIER
ncbi:hypothetical protein SV7mr_42320 [Stieleria bergensis]|uniref:LamG-like jellyroll fold domain-containing protein n=1 Tax=Stieleria bergensis TaxID=2528025 RepID=A0A517T042_9BACT|nr:hypothetical protein SV7mr_42320 [Planctomycetes bacterium SV_7m_r]